MNRSNIISVIDDFKDMKFLLPKEFLTAVLKSKIGVVLSYPELQSPLRLRFLFSRHTK